MDAFVARQPIFNKNMQIYAYELLFCDGTDKYLPEMDGDLATNQVLSNSVINIGMNEICGGKKSFINFTANLLIKQVPLLLSKENVVVEILEDVEPEEELLQACREMSNKGFQLALDDFVYIPKLRPLIELADIIKFDFRISTIAEIESYIEQLPEPKPRLLAEKIETKEEYEIALKMGFEYFQGYFFCKPEIIKGKKIGTSQLAQLEIMAAINGDDLDFAKITDLVLHDVGISYKLLRYINSPFYAKPQKISSIKHALVYMGAPELRRFISLMTISNLAAGKPEELISMACIRGKFCELLGNISDKKVNISELFTVGMFSLLDTILGQPMPDILEKIPLSQNLVTALVEKKGLLAAFLIMVVAYEQGRWPIVKTLAGKLKVDEDKVPALYLEACQWSNSVVAS